MNHASTFSFRKCLGNVASIFLQFAHGGLVVTGLVVAGLIGTQIGHNGIANTQGQLKAWLASGSSSQGGVFTDLFSAPGEPAASGDSLTPDMQGVADYLARRYHVANPAVQPMVAAAHAVGSRMGLDPMLILAVVAIESSFNPFAESHLGARGLMQIIPKYHQDKLAQQEQENPLLDPITNIEVGAQVLKESIRRAGGDITSGLQQYGGASDDATAQYANKVLAVKQQLDHARLQAMRHMGA